MHVQTAWSADLCSMLMAGISAALGPASRPGGLIWLVRVGSRLTSNRPRRIGQHLLYSVLSCSERSCG